MTLPVVAIVGATGFIGPKLIKAIFSKPFEDKFSFPIRIVTSNETKANEKIPEIAANPSKIKLYTSADIVTGQGLDQAFEGVDIVIDLAGFRFSHDNIFDAVVASKAKVYIPSEFGSPGPEFGNYGSMFQKKADVRERFHSANGLKTVSIFTGIFTEYAFSVPGLGGLGANASATIYMPDAKWSTTSLLDTGKLVATIASKALEPESLPEYIYAKGGDLTREIVAQYYTEITGNTLTIEKKASTDITSAADKVAEKGIHGMQDFFTVFTAVLTQGYSHFELKGTEFLKEFVYF